MTDEIHISLLNLPFLKKYLKILISEKMRRRLNYTFLTKMFTIFKRIWMLRPSRQIP